MKISIFPNLFSRTRRTGAAAAALLALVATLPALAQSEPIEEIIVTGEFRGSRLEDSPASISVVRLEDQKAATVNHLEEVIGWLPNVSLASGASRARFIQIRGIGERGQFAEPLNPSVGLVLDGVDMSGIGTAATLFDVQQVEVLRGPQGTLYGANALAGLINVVSNDPTDTRYTRVRLDGGDYGALGAGVVLAGPASADLGYRLAVQHYEDDGFMKNRFLGKDDTAGHDEFTARAKLRWEPRDDLRWTAMLGYVDVDNGYDAFSLDNDRNTLSDEPGRDVQESVFGSLRVNWDMSEAVSFQGTLGLADSDMDYGYDEDWTFDGFDPFGYSSTDRYRRDRETVSADLRLLSGPEGRLFGGTTDWVVGTYVLSQDVDLRRTYTYLSEDFLSAYRIDRYALYAEVSVPFGERTRLTVGARGERHEAEYADSEGVRFDPNDTMMGGRVVLQHDLSEATMAYASVTRGYKAGGFNISGTLDPALREYDPESLWNYEVGLKGLYLDGTLDLRAALFSMERDDVQVGTSVQISRPDGSVEFIDLVDNAAEGVNRGVELEVSYQPVEQVTLFASLGLLNTEFRDFVNSSGEDLDGEEQAHAPDYQFHAGAEYRPLPGWFVRLEAEGQDAFYYSNSRRFVDNPSDVRSDSYTLWHASAGYEAQRWSVKVWGRNLGDKDYTVRGYYFGNDPRDLYTERGFFQLGEPRRYGVTFTWEP